MYMVLWLQSRILMELKASLGFPSCCTTSADDICRVQEWIAIVGSATTKILNFMALHHHNWIFNMMLPLAIGCCDVFGVFEIPPEEVEQASCLYPRAHAMLLAPLISRVCRAMNVACAFTGSFAYHSIFVCQLQGDMCKLDALFIVPWDAWTKQTIAFGTADLQVPHDAPRMLRGMMIPLTNSLMFNRP